MSDPVTNVQIEDVLSSIRRLVSEGERLRDPRSAEVENDPPAASDQGRDEIPDVLELGAEHRTDQSAGDDDIAESAERESPVRFVLTSAYRVDRTVQRSDGMEAPEEATDEAAEADDDTWSVPEADIRGDEAEVTARAAEAAPDRDELDGNVDAARSGEIVWADDEHDVTEPVSFETGRSEGSETEAFESESGDDGTPSDEVPDWVALGQAELDALEAGIADSEPGESHSASTTEALSAGPEEAAPAHPAPEAPPEPEDAPSERSSDRRALESTIAELEAAISDASDDWEPDGSEDTPVMDWDSASEVGVFFSSRFTSGGPIEDAELSSPPSDEDDDEDETIAEKFEAAEAQFAEAEIEDAPDPLEDQLTAYLEQDEVLDEETLRRMVAEIVREELQGPLGERITRNVRKLVRREIYRALAEQGFE